MGTGAGCPNLAVLGVGEPKEITELGGEAGKAVWTARRKAELVLGGDEGGTTNGEDIRRRNVASDGGVGDGGEAGGGCPGEARDLEGGMVPALVERDMVAEMTLDLGGEERVTGDVARTPPDELPVENDGDAARRPVGDIARAA